LCRQENKILKQIAAMAKLKIKDIEGDAEDIYDLFQKSGCDLSSYIGAGTQSKTFSAWWIVSAITLFFVLSCCIWTGIFNLAWTKVGILSLFLLGFLIVILIQYKCRNHIITILSGIAGLAIIFIALNIYSPSEVAKKMEAATIKKYEK
jgi:hypothetical protein